MSRTNEDANFPAQYSFWRSYPSRGLEPRENSTMASEFIRAIPNYYGFYKPLNVPKQEIRVVILLPGDWASPLNCMLGYTSLTEIQEPVYEGLSYCWGDQVKLKTIHLLHGLPHNQMGAEHDLEESRIIDCRHPGLESLKGNLHSSTFYYLQNYSVTANLESALRHLRHKSKCRYLWIDAVSINQTDIAEKNAQVLLMCTVYEKASRVTVWLGEKAEDSDLAFRLIPKLVAAKKKREATSDTRTHLHLQDNNMDFFYDLPARRGGRDFPAYFQLFKRQWLFRGWVVQEAAVSKNLLVQCGLSTVSWDDFIISLIFCGDLDIIVDFDTVGTALLADIAVTRSAYQQGWPASLIMLILRHRSTTVADPRDKLYALCGMAFDAGTTEFEGFKSLDIQPDYNMPVADVYRDLAERILVHEHTLGLLYVPRDPAHLSTLNLPSWVPDLSLCPRTVSLLGVERNIRHDPLYSTAQESQCIPKFADGGRQACLSGFVFDTITEVGEHEDFFDGNADAFEPVKRLVYGYNRLRRAHNWRQLAGVNDGLFRHKKYVTGEEIKEVYWSVLVAGYHPGPEVPPERMKTFSNAWFRSWRTTAWLRVLPYPLFELALIVCLAVKAAWLMFRLSSFLALWTPDPPFYTVMGCQGNRRIFKTKMGFLGLACYDAEAGHLIAVCKGGRLPLVVRREGSKFAFVGDCYLHGIMKGEAFDEKKCEDLWFV